MNSSKMTFSLYSQQMSSWPKSTSKSALNDAETYYVVLESAANAVVLNLVSQHAEEFQLELFFRCALVVKAIKVQSVLKI